MTTQQCTAMHIRWPSSCRHHDSKLSCRTLPLSSSLRKAFCLDKRGAFRESNSLNKFYSAAVVVCFLTRKHGFITKTSMRKSFLLLWLHCFATCMAVKSHKRQQQNEKRHGNIYHIPYINNLMSCTHFSHTKYSNGRPCPIKTWDVIHSFLFSIGI